MNRSVFAPHGMVTSIDHLASTAGVAILQDGGTAVDAAIATNAVLAVTAQDQCGLGGDLFAIVHDTPGAPAVLNASGRSGSLANADQLRSQGHTLVPHRGNGAAVTVPGCVDGWMTMHEKYGRLDLRHVLGPAILYAENGFPASAGLVEAARSIANLNRHDFRGLTPGMRVVRPGIARSLRSIASGGRDDFYGGEFGAGLLEACSGQLTEADLADTNATWVSPLGLRLFGHDVWTAPPNSQGYLALAGTAIAERFGLPGDPNDPLWAHVMIEAARAAAHDRPQVLHEHAVGEDLLSADRLDQLSSRIEADHAISWRESWRDGGTIHLNVVDRDGMGVSLIQSNARGFGSHLRSGETGIFLQNRGIGFSLEAGHPAEFGPRLRPPHTLSPLIITGDDGLLRTVLGTMGGDAQPHILQQLLVRLLHHGQNPHEVVDAGRFVLMPTDPSSMFEVWEERGDVAVAIEPSRTASWSNGLEVRGHNVQTLSSDEAYGHAHCIDVTDDGMLMAASEPRVPASRAAGY